MYPEVMAREQAEQDNIERDHAIRLAELAGIDNPESKVDLEVPATVRFGDPTLYALMLQKSRNALVDEALRKLEGESDAEPVEYPQVPPEGKPEGESLPQEVDHQRDESERKLEDVDGIGPDLAVELESQGYESPDDLKEASDEELLAVDGIGQAKLAKIREDLA